MPSTQYRGWGLKALPALGVVATILINFPELRIPR